MKKWIKKNELVLRDLYYKKNTSLSNTISTPSKSISFEDWGAYAYHFRETHPDFKRISSEKRILQGNSYRIIERQNSTEKPIYQIQKKYWLFGWKKEISLLENLFKGYQDFDLVLNIFNELEIKKQIT